MSRQGIAYDWKFLASVLANEDSKSQAEFFKAFVKEMQSWECSNFQRMTQLAWINNELTPKEKELLAMIGYEGGR
jgi:hypothetical protein